MDKLNPNPIDVVVYTAVTFVAMPLVAVLGPKRAEDLARKLGLIR